MTDETRKPFDASNPFGAFLDSPFFDMKGDAMQAMLAGAMPSGVASQDGASGLSALLPAKVDPSDLAEWAKAGAQMQQMWLEFATERAQKAAESGSKGAKGASKGMLDPAQWLLISKSMLTQMPQGLAEAHARLAQDSLELWQGVMGGMARSLSGMSGDEEASAPELPKKDRRFADSEWTTHPAFALLHQTYLMLAEYFRQSVKSVDGLSSEKRKQLEFAVNALAEAMSPANFILSNPVVLKRTVETRGQNLVRGMQHLITDLKRGQLTHTDPNAFTLGENLAATPGKVVHETPLYQLIQYSPSTKDVLETPLVIFPPWINRFYILDLTPKKSFIKWAVDQGLTVFVVSWRSANEELAKWSGTTTSAPRWTRSTRFAPG